MGISARKIIVGEAIVAERAPPPVEPPKEVLKQLRDINGKLKVGNLIDLSRSRYTGIGADVTDKRLSSYFVVRKDSDYLNHHKNS